MLHFYPTLSNQSKFLKDYSNALSEEYTQFLDRFEKVVFISFGTIYNPDKTDADKLIRMIRESNELYPQIGFIFALKKSHPSYEYL